MINYAWRNYELIYSIYLALINIVEYLVASLELSSGGLEVQGFPAVLLDQK